MNKNKLKKIVFLLVIFTLAPIVTTANSNSEDRRRPQGPPPEAIKACEGKNPGETTTFKGRRGELLTATCEEIEGQLAAVPEDGPR